MTLYRITHKSSGMTYVGVGSKGEKLADSFYKLSNQSKLCPSLYHDIQAFGNKEFETKRIEHHEDVIKLAHREEELIEEYGPLAYNQEPIMKKIFNL